jgi:hypothetical protein
VPPTLPDVRPAGSVPGVVSTPTRSRVVKWRFVTTTSDLSLVKSSTPVRAQFVRRVTRWRIRARENLGCTR